MSFLFSCLWVAGIGAYVVGLVGIEKALTLSNDWYFLIAAVVIVPIALAFLIAVFAREASILRQQSTSLAAVASHLIAPEETASKNLARLSRAIRRELDAFNSAVEAASVRMASLETASNERLALIERTATAAQERVERATNRLGSEREKLAQFTQALDSVVLAASETLTTRLQDARAAARSASESLHAEHGAIAGLISTLQSASHAVSAKALETGKEIERQAQRLDAASEAAAARSEQVVARHERQRAALAETIERLKQENDHMARALDYQREGMNKLVITMVDENKKIGTFTVEGARRLDDAAALMAQRIVETTQLFAREAEKLRTSTELTTSGLEQAMQTIRSAGDSSFDAAGRLGSVLVGLRDTATTASQQIEGTVTRLSKMLNELPSEAAHHVKTLRGMLDQQSNTMRELNSKVSAAFDRVQAIEMAKAPTPLQLEAPIHTTIAQPPAQMPMTRQQMMPQQPIPMHHQTMQHPSVHPQQLPQFSVSPQEAAAAMGGHQKSHVAQPGREAQPLQRQPVPQFRAPPMQDHGVPNFNVPPPGAQLPLPGYSQNRNSGPHMDRPQASESGESRGWFGLAKRFVRPSSDEPEAPMDDRNGSWDMKSLLAAAEVRETDRRHPVPQQPVQGSRRMDPRDPRAGERGMQNDIPHQHHQPHQQHPQHTQHPQQVRQQAPQAVPPRNALQQQADAQAGNGHPGHTSSRHMIETLQAMAIDLSRFLEDDPPVDLLRRYRNGERNVFARRLASILGAEHVRLIAGKYQEDREFRDTVDRYIQQFEALLEQTARSDRENVLVETYLTSQTGKVYVTLASAIGRLS
ncbi:MAG: hypothetical protein ABL973_17275 [Micropepsaceae bacterium]